MLPSTLDLVLRLCREAIVAWSGNSHSICADGSDPNHSGAVNDGSLAQALQKKTIVYGRDEGGRIVKVGQAMNGYCQGVLEGMFATLVHSKAICAKEKSATADYLLSVVLTYREQTKSRDNDAARVVATAFKRAFGCK